ncbi:MAG: Gldg family protein [Kiritimatiellae bacterium]|nr:Gldg family protein [Kiritimatiellia bacterium]
MRTIRVMFVRMFGCLWISWSSLVGVLAFLILSSGFFLRALMRGDGGSTPVAALWALAASPFLPVMATLVTMRLVADERADGRLELLLAAPVRERDVVLGKFLGAVAQMAVALAVYLLVPLLVLPLCAPTLSGHLSLVAFLPALAALLLQMATWCAFGLCASACCRHAAVAAVTTLVLVLALPHAVFQAGVAWFPVLRARFAEMPFDAHVIDLATGLFSTATVAFYLVLTCFGLFVATKAVAMARVRGKAARLFRFSTFFVVALAAVFSCGVIAIAMRLDVPFEISFRSADSEVSARTRQILAETQGDVDVTCFLAEKAPERRVVARLVRGLAAAARMVGGARLNVEWVDPRWNVGGAARLARQGTAEGSIVFRRGRRRQEVPAAALFSTTNGELRVTEGGVFVGEEVCASALQNLSRPKMHETIYWTTGHGETPLDSYDSVTGMSDIVRELRRDGYRMKTLDLAVSPSVPADCTVLVVAAAREPFSRIEQLRLQGYLETGGRLLVLTTGVPNAGVSALLADWGVKQQSFSVVSTRTLSGSDVIVTDFADHRITAPLKGSTVLFEGASPLVPADGHDQAEFTALAKTDAAAWGETDISVQPWAFDPTSEPRGPLTLAVALERGGIEAPDLVLRPTRLVVISDGMFVANGALATRGNANRDFFLNSMAWLAGLDTLSAVRTPGNMVVTGLDRKGWLRFGTWTGVLILSFAGLVLLTSLRRR